MIEIICAFRIDLLFESMSIYPQVHASLKKTTPANAWHKCE